MLYPILAFVVIMVDSIQDDLLQFVKKKESFHFLIIPTHINGITVEGVGHISEVSSGRVFWEGYNGYVYHTNRGVGEENLQGKKWV